MPHAPFAPRPAGRQRTRLMLTVCMALAVPFIAPVAGPLAAQQADIQTTAIQTPEIQPLPQWTSTTVNDFAGLLTPDDARALDDELARLQQETGIEGTVVTLTDRATYGGTGDDTGGLERFGTRLFNHWGVGDAAHDNGFMLLVLNQDHEVRIELGASYPGDADIPAQEILRNTILPGMREGSPSAAIRAGTEAIITHIALPFATGQQSRPMSAGRDWNDLAGGAIATLLVLLGGATILRGVRRNRRCPECGKWDLKTRTEPVREDLPEGGWRISQTSRISQCPACGWQTSRAIAAQHVMTYGPDGTMRSRSQNPLAMRGRGQSSGGGSGFGGGSSRGGGASGRW